MDLSLNLFQSLGKILRGNVLAKLGVSGDTKPYNSIYLSAFLSFAVNRL